MSSAKRKPTTPELPVEAFASSARWSAWLKKNHATSKGLWIKIFKKGSGVPTVTYPEAVEVALCWGWIDGLRRAHDDAAFLQRFTPRGPKSLWSQINRDKVGALIEAGRMQPPGLREVERAKADGRWAAAYASPKNATVPDDLAAAFEKNQRAAAFFTTLDSANRYAVLFRIHNAKTPETRRRWVERLVKMLEAHEKLHP
jgi:uncharacterized protein YdeI (YjbR/CyaY-like superfamily)